MEPEMEELLKGGGASMALHEVHALVSAARREEQGPLLQRDKMGRIDTPFPIDVRLHSRKCKLIYSR